MYTHQNYKPIKFWVYAVFLASTLFVFRQTDGPLTALSCEWPLLLWLLRIHSPNLRVHNMFSFHWCPYRTRMCPFLFYIPSHDLKSLQFRVLVNTELLTLSANRYSEFRTVRNVSAGSFRIHPCINHFISRRHKVSLIHRLTERTFLKYIYCGKLFTHLS